MRLAFVVQRYGLEIAGGAEYHCRLIAEHMAHHAEVEVLTTCAADYITWANHYPEGVETLNGVRVRRFRVKRPRDTARFSTWSDHVLGPAPMRALPASDTKAQLRWLEEEGPFSPRLVRHVEKRRDNFDFFVFFSYRYYTTYHGLRAVPDKALLVPTAEDDGVYRMAIFPPLFRMPRAIIYNSVEERSMIEAASGNHQVPGDVVGVGSALPARLDAEGFRRKHGLDGRFMLYSAASTRTRDAGSCSRSSASIARKRDPVSGWSSSASRSSRCHRTRGSCTSASCRIGTSGTPSRRPTSSSCLHATRASPW